jgi:hypothetical protein
MSNLVRGGADIVFCLSIASLIGTRIRRGTENMEQLAQIMGTLEVVICGYQCWVAFIHEIKMQTQDDRNGIRAFYDDQGRWHSWRPTDKWGLRHAQKLGILHMRIEETEPKFNFRTRGTVIPGPLETINRTH